MSPPRAQAAKKTSGVRADDATMAGVRKMPMPMIRLTTIIVASKVVSLALMLIGPPQFGPFYAGPGIFANPRGLPGGPRRTAGERPGWDPRRGPRRAS